MKIKRVQVVNTHGWWKYAVRVRFKLIPFIWITELKTDRQREAIEYAEELVKNGGVIWDSGDL